MDLLTCDLPGIKKLRSGKVREVFDLGENLLLVATDRISAFDCILPNAIPGKGAVLNGLSTFWFHRLDFVPNHMIETEVAAFPAELKPFADILRGRSMIAKKATPLPVECAMAPDHSTRAFPGLVCSARSSVVSVSARAT